MNLGAHISIAGGIYQIFERAREVTANSIQIFVTNQNQWNTKVPSKAEIELFFQQRAAYNPYTIITHSRYLINLCSPDDITRSKSIKAFREELELCELLEIPYLVIHPGSYLDRDEQWGLDTIIENIDLTIKGFPQLKTVILLETTAGQGTNLGYRFEHLHYLIDKSAYPQNLAVCFDSCHSFTAGYDLKNRYEDIFDEFDRIVGLSAIKAFHINDSKKEFASRKDRHEHIGQGELGIEPFARLMNDRRFAEVPMILETPKGDNDEMDIVNLKVLRDLRKT